MCMFTDAVLIGMGALDGKELFAIEGSEKLALNSGTIRRSAKNDQKAEKPVKPPGRHKHRHKARGSNVQISSANLRVDIRVNLHVENMNFFSKSSWTDA